MIKTPILIVGAGPTGLMLSAQLHRYGAPHVIVDQKPGITKLSKALAVQARTLEQYRQLGIVDAALGQGFVANGARFIINGQVRASVPLGEIGKGLSPYPYLYILEQSKNEALLHDYITKNGGGVSWDAEVVDLHKNGTGYRGTIKRGDGSSSEFECDYLIGCGGASSFVRHFFELPFEGGTNEQMFFVADLEMQLELDKQGLLLVINNNEFLAFFPMEGVDRYRVIGVLPPSIEDLENIPFDLLKTHIEENFGFEGKITGHSWTSRYKVHHRIASNFRAQNGFLAGDAAHIHSPAGGQGMNTGLGDSVNLGWKLAGVVNGWSSPKLLDSYDEERRPFGKQLVHTTDRAFGLIVSKNWGPRFIRTHILPRALSIILKFSALRRLMFQTISQTVINYRPSSQSDGSRFKKIHSGDRFPWFEWPGGNSFDWLQGVGYVVLCFGGAGALKVEGWSGPVIDIVVTGASARASSAAGLPVTGCVIVRPDMHISHISGQ